ncbi:sensor histidine kinase [Xylophilus sp. GW821-FHT01B05]
MNTDVRGSARSLWQQLATPLLALWVASALLATGAAYWLAGRSTNLSFDRILADDARALASQLRWSGGRAAFVANKETADSLVFDSLARTHYLIRTESGRTLVGDLSIDLPLPPQDGATHEPRVFDLESAGSALRAVTLRLAPTPGDEPVWVLVAESKAARQHVSQEIALAIFMPAALAGFVIIPLVFLGIRRGLAPTRRISAEVALHGVHDLSPLPTEHVPEELRALVLHTNELLFRLKASIDEQRRFIADAAHQLQTPVAGIRLLVGDMRRIQRADPLQPADGEVLAQLDEVAVRTARLVRQLLAFARAEDDTVVEDELFDCAAVVAEAGRRWQAPVLAAGKQLQLPQPSALPATVRGSPTLLGEVVSNLVDNALRYGGTQIEVLLQVQPDEVLLAVCDDGPALDADTHAQMLLPFWRGAHGQPEGSGLGLSIAQRVVLRMGGTLAARQASEAGGTCIEIRLPRVG